MMDPEQGMMAEVDNPLGASAGDTVRIETAGAEGKVKAALLLYGFPLLAMLAGAIGFQSLFRALGLGAAAEGLAVLAGLLLLAASFGLLYLIRRRSGKQSLRSRIVEILERSEASQLSQ
jgi:positive regulator of sigma E activity